MDTTADVCAIQDIGDALKTLEVKGPATKEERAKVKTSVTH